MDENRENGNGNGASVITSKEAALDDRDWGPVEDDDTVVLSLPDRAHNWIKVKRYITEADDAAAAQAAIARGITMQTATNQNGNRAARRANGNAAAADSTQTYHFDTVAQRSTLLLRMIRDWSFKDKQTGAPLPITARSIGSLPVFTRDFIMQKLDELNPAGDQIDDSLPEELDQRGENTGPLEEPINASY